MTKACDGSSKVVKVLIADDDPAVLKALASRCAAIGFEVETAANGLHALVMARRRQPDILIVDVNMPELDGLSLCTHLLDPAMKSIHVIVVTGSEDPDTKIRCESMGTFYGDKKSNFWSSISLALAEIAPEMADRIMDLEARSIGARVPIRPRVLVVDDDPDMNSFLSSRLAKFNVETLYASNAAHGYKIALKEHPSVIVSDFSMPNGDAFYLLGKLRSTPETESIPFIVLSGHNLEKLTERGLMQESRGRSGAVKIFRKSENIDELFESLRKYCGFQKKWVQE
jgi:CheY-like chemotaxis protein